jgi:hypothetical protein
MRGRYLAILLLVLAALALACSSTAPVNGKAAGEVCSTTSECAVGSCLGLAVYPPDGGCSVVGTSCTTGCSTDADCASLGSNFKCFEGCPGGQKTCGAT